MTSVDDILDLELGELEDLPEFKPFSPGAHRVTCSLDTKTVNDKPAVEASFKYGECIEAADGVSDSDQSKEGDEASTLFFLDNEIGRGKFKKFCSSIADGLQMSNPKLSEVIEQVQDLELIIISGITVNKDDPDRKYMDVKEASVA